MILPLEIKNLGWENPPSSEFSPSHPEVFIETADVLHTIALNKGIIDYPYLPHYFKSSLLHQSMIPHEVRVRASREQFLPDKITNPDQKEQLIELWACTMLAFGNTVSNVLFGRPHGLSEKVRQNTLELFQAFVTPAHFPLLKIFAKESSDFDWFIHQMVGSDLDSLYFRPDTSLLLEQEYIGAMKLTPLDGGSHPGVVTETLSAINPGVRDIKIPKFIEIMRDNTAKLLASKILNTGFENISGIGSSYGGLSYKDRLIAVQRDLFDRLGYKLGLRTDGIIIGSDRFSKRLSSDTVEQNIEQVQEIITTLLSSSNLDPHDLLASIWSNTIASQPLGVGNKRVGFFVALSYLVEKMHTDYRFRRTTTDSFVPVVFQGHTLVDEVIGKIARNPSSELATDDEIKEMAQALRTIEHYQLGNYALRMYEKGYSKTI
jgi:hypothetical protein